MQFCPHCGGQPRVDAAFCNHCGAKLADPATAQQHAAAGPATAGPASDPARAGASNAGWASRPIIYPWQANLPAPLNAIPADLLAVVAAMMLGGVLILWPVLRALPDTFNLLGDGRFARDIGLLLLAALLVLGFFGFACLVLAWKLAHRDPVGRGLSYVLLGGVVAGIAIGDNHSTDLILAMLTSLAALGVLALSPHVRAFFATRDDSQPTSVVIARTLVTVWAACALLVGLLYVPLGDLGAKFVVVGVLLLAAAGTTLYFSGRLVGGDPAARMVTSALMGSYLVLLLIIGRSYPGLILPLALCAGAVAFLWWPADARAHFAPRPVTPQAPGSWG